ncbi:MAG TPA: menaquinone biosynthesis protein [Bacteroidales bacterium]|nr:menaquinone biosynthesis protein [Bacteroidales bacterium]HSA43334.1 menaquinone biosynthesis protein [Bacteroidales bacterium]
MFRKTLRISAISYLNTTPFVYGIKYSGFLDNYEMSFDVPATCAEKLIRRQADIGIVPVAAINAIPDARMLTDYCIGAEGPVKTVLLVSLSPIEDIDTVYLDPDSRTSVKLCRILEHYHWKKKFNYARLEPELLQYLPAGSGAVIIGDKTFGIESVYPRIYDLSGEWYHMTRLPFVFACWVSPGPLSPQVVDKFNKAISYGVTHLDEVIDSIDPAIFPDVDLRGYFYNNLSYGLDDLKRQGMNEFLRLAATLP